MFQAFTAESPMYLKLQSHLKTAGCFYHHLIVRLEREFSVDLKGVVLFSRSNQSSSQVQDYVQGNAVD